MLSQLYNKSSIFHPINTFNNLIAGIGIGSKILLENTGLVKPEQFTDFGGYEKLNKNDKRLLDDNY